jgi:peptidoglycan/xylan/chitin deacetylase (PgdA/CDA1 family)
MRETVVDDEQSASGRTVDQGKVRTMNWPTSDEVYVTLDLECDFGTALEANVYQALSRTDRLVSILEASSVPLTCFVQTEVLETNPESVERLRDSDIDVRFHPHSHTHRPRDQTLVQTEIEVSTDLFTDFFGRRPTAYRFPNGNVRPADYRVLNSAGYEFDASVFPTWRPGRFNNVDSSTTPTYLEEFDIVEIPFTILSRYLPIPTGLSYARLFGRPYTHRLVRSPPTALVFNIHMHDLWTPPSVTDLPWVYRLVYSRNNNGFEILRRLLDRFQRLGYSFGLIDDIHDELRTGLPASSIP